MELLLALKDAIESDARMDAKQKKQWFDHLVTARKEFYNRWVKEDVHRALFASFQDEAQQLLEKYLDEIEASLDQRKVTDPMTGENRRTGRAIHAIGGGENQGIGVGQAVIPAGSHPQGHGRVQGRARSSASRAMRACARPSSNTFSRSAATCCAW